MLQKLNLVLVLIFSTYISANSQYTEAFNKIDAKHAFKDVVFGSFYNSLKTKMDLKSFENSPPNYYFINNKKYLTIGEFNCESGMAIFSNKNKLTNISLSINISGAIDFDYILNYFTEMFGTPIEIGQDYYWRGYKINYSLGHVKNLSDEALLLISSNIFLNDRGKDNF